MFGAFDPSGHPVLFPNSRILAHELCGHGRLRQDYTHMAPDPPYRAQEPGHRRGHDATINTGNAITGTPVRGTYTNPRYGESFHQLPHSTAKLVFWQPDGLHYEQVA